MRVLFLLPLFLLLVACGRSQPTVYYAFPVKETKVVQDRLPQTTLRIARVAVPQYLEREPIVVRNKNNTAFTVDFVHVWAEPLGEGVRRILHSVLFEPLLASGITVLPATTESNGTYTLLFDILALDTSHNAAQLSAQWSLTDSNNTVLADGVFSDSKALADTNNYNALVEAESALIHACAEHMLTQVRTALTKKQR